MCSGISTPDKQQGSQIFLGVLVSKHQAGSRLARRSWWFLQYSKFAWSQREDWEEEETDHETRCSTDIAPCEYEKAVPSAHYDTSILAPYSMPICSRSSARHRVSTHEQRKPHPLLFCWQQAAARLHSPSWATSRNPHFQMDSGS